ncbi:ATP-dependent RNA helicase [Treponema bryantii]|uniref:ATP-dependent RNA helicase n=1 Tax=Treponema bryantii TaxID=163 RepID=UPI0003B76B36|nr:ATP-dependent helicase C-terminal domain-containing protein [Treponema bryantii]
MDFPIIPYLDDICDTLKKSPSRFLILTAETAAGKSTVLPLALLQKFSGKILMTEPRRLAVLGVANRVSELWSGECGGKADEVGYKIHLEKHVTRDTRLEVVTEAILVRQLQNDPALEDYNLVVLDEFHERSVNTDLALAFLKEAMQLRDDLFVIVMSATIDTGKLVWWLSRTESVSKPPVDVPVFKVPGRLFPVKVVYEPEKSLVTLIKEVLRSDVVSIRPSAYSTTGNKQAGNILVFLPGIADIRRAQEELEASGLFGNDSNSDLELCILHSSISLEEQKKVLAPSPKRRVILSSAIAETSLTVPGVSIVIDSGLARINRLDINSGMEKLSTERECEFSAEQRKGRAGRLCEGTCIRLWDQHDPRVKELDPEILRADLVPLVLECSERGVYSLDGIDWLDKPSAAAWTESAALLRQLGMLKADGHITDKGKAALTLGLHPRLAGIALADFDSASGKLGDEGRRLLIQFSSYSRSSVELQKRFIADLERRLAASGYKKSERPDFLILCGYPDRLAKRMSEVGVDPAEYKFAGGRQAKLYNKRAPLWLVAPEVMAGNKEAVIFDLVELDEAKIAEFLEKHCEIREKCSFTQGTLQKFEEKCFGEIILSSKKIPLSEGDYGRAWVTEIEEKGIECLPLNDKINNLLLRAEFIEQQKGSGEKLKEKLQTSVEEWLVPFLAGKNSLDGATVYDALYWYLEGAEIDRQAPEMLTLENGRRVKVKYEKQAEIRPVIEIIIQRIFGCFATPQICGKKVLLRLLSPASRPLQVTEDLEHFWTGAWVEICKEMKGRYPKHNWDYTVVE